MKTTQIVRRCIASTRSVTLFAAAALMSFNGRATDGTKSMKPMKGGEHLLMLQEVKTQQELNSLKADDTIAMVCAKCKTVWTTRIKAGTKGGQILAEGAQPKEIIGTHACAGCKSELTVVGVQKNAHTELKHSCKVCGDDSGFCCATKSSPGANKGTEEKSRIKQKQ